MSAVVIAAALAVLGWVLERREPADGWHTDGFTCRLEGEMCYGQFESALPLPDGEPTDG